MYMSVYTMDHLHKVHILVRKNIHKYIAAHHPVKAIAQHTLTFRRNAPWSTSWILALLPTGCLRFLSML